MRSIPLALTWEFWQQARGALLSTVIFLVAFVAFIYKGLQLDYLYAVDVTNRPDLQMLCFIFVMIGVVAVVCGATESPRYRFTLPVSMRASVLLPMLNGAFATVVSYLAVALLANSAFDAQWAVVKPTLFAVCIYSVCQAVAWMIWSSPNLRAPIAAGMCAILCVGVFVWLDHQIQDHGQLFRAWSTIQPLEMSLAILTPLTAYFFSLGILKLARRGQIFSVTKIGRWLLSKLDSAFAARAHRMTPMAAELWSEWTCRGRVLQAGPILTAATLCGFFLSGRFGWESARGAIIAFTWVQVMIGSVLGLFIGHVGERFDFREHLATRPLSDMQLADVKLRSTLKCVCWTWINWAIGVNVAIVCLALVGQAPNSWSDIVPPGNLIPLSINVVMIPILSWTLTSLGVSIAILRPWMVKLVFSTIALLPAVPFGLLFLMPEAESEIFAAARWGWICLTIGGTVALYATAFRLRLISAKRVAIVGMSYLLFCATCLTVLSFLPPIEVSRSLVVSFLFSSCILPFVCVAAVPLAVWWNRHR